MSIRFKILAGCLALTLLTGMLGAYTHVAERRLGDLALRFYDEAFMAMSYLRAAQVGFARLAAGAGQPDDVGEVLDDLAVAQDRALSRTGRTEMEALRAHVAAVLPRAAPAEVAAVQAEFERTVETFAADGFRYRQRVGLMVSGEMHRTWEAICGSLLAALTITAIVSHLITPSVRRAVRVAQAIAAGRLDNRIEPRGRGETADLLRALSIMQASIAAALGRIKALMADQAANHAGEIAAQHARMEAALDNMNQGLCLFDAAGRLAVTNRRFAEMFGAAALGNSHRQVLEAVGLAAVLDASRNGVLTAFSCDLPDGRAIAVSQQAVAGGGWVATYEDITERRAVEARMAHIARHDALTGLPNRLLFGEHTRGALARARRDGTTAMLCLDLDGFRAVNDTLGHPAGDALLRLVAQRLRDNTRETDLVVRLGGDEFAVVQEDAGQPAEAAALARRLVEVLAEPFEVERQPVMIGTSIGIALSDDGLTTPEALLKSAELALDRAKSGGRGTWRFFEADMDAQLQARRALELDLRSALAEDQFELFYQPLVRLDAGISGFEALIRWQHPVRGLVSPASFIPLAEEIGLIGALGSWVLRRACADAASWPAALKVAVNLSPAQFRGGRLADEVAAALADSGLPASLLELEITESILLQDDDAVLAVLHAIRNMGVRIAMDDFGTGYSSLGYLRRFPFDKIKIDQSFTGGVTDRADCLAIVRAVIGLGRSLGMAVNAEGVETPEQLAVLRSEGCGELQGYLFSRPQPNREVRGLLHRHGCAAPLRSSGRDDERQRLLPADAAAL